jgi:hypothetical protein
MKLELFVSRRKLSPSTAMHWKLIWVLFLDPFDAAQQLVLNNLMILRKDKFQKTLINYWIFFV